MIDDTDHGHLYVSCQNKYLTSLEELERSSFMKRPSVMLGVKVFKDGNRWCALYGSNIQDGVCGFGETPDKACEQFDKEWFGK